LQSVPIKKLIHIIRIESNKKRAVWQVLFVDVNTYLFR